MNPPAQNQPRLLPFDRESPGSWQRWEDFWLDFLNANPLLPWPGSPFWFKRSIAAEKWGSAGGDQDGIDLRADMEDGTILAVQCKDWKTVDPTKARKAMDKAETEFKTAKAYFLVFTAKEIPKQIQDEADRRGNWKVIGRDTLSSWFFAEKFLNLEAQKRLIERHFGELWLKKVFPQPWDELLIPSSKFFDGSGLIRHDARLQGREFLDLVETLSAAVGEGNPRITILSAPGGQGKTRLLKATAERVESKYPNRKVRFHNDSAEADAEDYGIRGVDFKDLCLFVDDAHRSENLKKRLLRMVAESGTASLLIAARPNNLRALELRLEKSGFRESDWQKFEVPILDYAGRRALTAEILGNDDGRTPDFLAGESERCPLICTVGAELVRSGGIGQDVLKSDHFKRRVFDRLMESSLDYLFSEDPEYRKTSELCLRAIALIAPVSKSDELAVYLARVTNRNSLDIDPILSQLEEVGLLRAARGSLRVLPDLLSDHLVYDTAYGSGKIPSLIRNLMETPCDTGLTLFFANLAEAEWWARQEGKADLFLVHMWDGLREILHNPDSQQIFGILSAWRKIAIFQPGRTLELVRIILDQEAARIAAGIAKLPYKYFRGDPISLYLDVLPELLAPVAMHHRDHRSAAYDLLWQLGKTQGDSAQSPGGYPSAWQTIVRTASLAHWKKGGPQDTFEWLVSWALRPEGQAVLEEGRSFLSNVASQWFGSRFNRSWSEVEAIHDFISEIREFRVDVLSWIETEIISSGIGPSWAVLPVIYAAGNNRLKTDITPEGSVDSVLAKSIKILRRILEFDDDPVVRFSVWQYLSKRVAEDEPDDQKVEWLALRNSISRDLPFLWVRLASGFANQEWHHEQLQTRERSEDYDPHIQWWSDLASQSVSELRCTHPTIRKSLEQLDQVNHSLVRFRQHATWDIVAEAWSKQFPSERIAVLEELMRCPEHALVPCLGHFLGLRDEINGDLAESYSLRALSHPDGRIRRAVLKRLAWQDVKRTPQIADKLKEMSASNDPTVVSDMALFVSWSHFEVTPFFDEVLSALNVDVLSIAELVGVAEAVANLLQYTQHPISPNLLTAFFQRLEREEDLNHVIPDRVMLVFHEKFPVEMFKVHLNRIRAGKFLPWLLDGWFLSRLPEQLDHPEFEKFARELFDETIRSDDDQFHSYNQLFDIAVAQVDSKLAAELLTEELRKPSSRVVAALKRIVDLTGAGHGSVVYDAPDFTKELLKEIGSLPALVAKELYGRLVFGAVSHTWSSTNGSIGQEYLWAKDKAGRLAEHHRAEPLLRNFYLAIVKNQDDLTNRERRRHLDED